MQIPMVFESLAIETKKFPDKAFYIVSCGGLAYFAANGDPKAASAVLVRVKIDDELPVRPLFALLPDANEFRPFEKSVSLGKCMPCC